MTYAETFLLAWACVATALAVKFYYDFMRVIRGANEAMEASITAFIGVAEGRLDIIKVAGGIKVVKKGETE